MEWIIALGIILILIGPIGIVLIYILVIRAICNYMAKRNAATFDYDYLAQRIAEETCKRIMIIERQKETAYKGATNVAGDQAEDETEHSHANKAPGA